MDKHSQITRQQFQMLLERANKRFGKLRELQTRGDHSWATAQTLFHKTFDSFSRLWQFQLDNRPALLETGLQRSELGAIANQIGQLYYNYYLRSGDAGALLESYTFYDAVHTRQYFASATGGASDPAAAARQMRFYARFVVVCLFLHRRQEAMQLLQELQASVSSYVLQYSPPDAADWQLVVNEVAALMAADQVAMPLPRCPGSLEVPYTPTLRCRPTDPAAACAPHRPRLHEAILVSYRPRQIKVAELPLELYRMAQALEWQQQQPSPPPPQQQLSASADGGPTATSSANAAAGGVDRSAGGAEPSDAAEPTSHSLNHSLNHSLSQPSTAPERATTSGRGGGGGRDSQSAAAAAEAAGAQRQQQPLGESGPSPAPSGRSPPRQLLHRPTVQRLLSTLLAVTAGVEQTAAGEQFILLYISADAASAAAAVGQGHSGTEASGVASASSSSSPSAAAPVRQLLLRPPPHPHKSQAAAASAQAQPQPPPPPPLLLLQPSAESGAATAASADGLLAPEELLSATRRRLLLVVDSDMGRDFGRLQGHERGFPLLCLTSPPWQALTTGPGPGPGPDPSRYGSLTAMALSCPAQALCALAGQTDPQPQALQQLQEVLDDVLFRLGKQMAEQLAAAAQGSVAATTPAAATAAAAPETPDAGPNGGRDTPDAAGPCPSIPAAAAVAPPAPCCTAATTPSFAAWAPIFEDCLARRLLLHFALYRACVHMHPRRHPDPARSPSAFPPLPPAADPTSELLRWGVQRAAEVVGRRGVFSGQ